MDDRATTIKERPCSFSGARHQWPAFFVQNKNHFTPFSQQPKQTFAVFPAASAYAPCNACLPARLSSIMLRSGSRSFCETTSLKSTVVPPRRGARFVPNPKVVCCHRFESLRLEKHLRVGQLSQTQRRLEIFSRS